MGFLASTLAVLDDDPPPEELVRKETRGGLPDVLALLLLLDPPLVVPPAPEMFEDFAEAGFAAGGCPVWTVLVLLDGVKGAGFSASWICAWI